MLYRNLWTDPKAKKPKLSHIVHEGDVVLKESDPVFMRIVDDDREAFEVGRYRKATELKNGKAETVDEYWITDELAECEPECVAAWMEPPKADAINGEWIASMLVGDCDYCEHLTNLRDTSPCMNCVHAPVGSIVPDPQNRNNWALTKIYRPSIEERTVYPE